MKWWGLKILLLTSVTLLLAGCALAPVNEVTPSGGESPLAAPAAAPQTDMAPAATQAVSPAATPAAAVPPSLAGEEQPVPTANVAVAGIPGDILNAVLDDAAQRLGIAPDALVVTKAEAVTWPDGSLGCPEPGMFYTQALVDGYWIVVEADNQSLDYRASGGGNFRICDMPLPAGPVKP